MNYDKNFIELINLSNQSFTGWDFSFITGTGRMKSGLLTWSYGSMALPLIKKSKSMLDMGTGGGEFLSMLRPYPPIAYATEGYSPNVPIARKRLEPLGVNLIEIKEDSNLPFSNGQFDLILNQHESYCEAEVKRIISGDGVFLTQQVGGLDCSEVNQHLGVPLNKDLNNWNVETALTKLKQNGFKMLGHKEEYPVQRFFDIGALNYYLKAIPWQIPNFTTENYLEQLYSIHQKIKKNGYFDVKQHRFYIYARAN